MATTSIWKVEGSIRKVLTYVMNPQKTEQQLFVSGVNCTPESAADEMLATKELYGKAGGIVGFHGYQSFVPGEVTPEQAHEIGVKLATEVFGERFEVIVTTHLDQEHLHNHIVLNSVSFADGKRFYRSKKDYLLIRDTSDRLCSEYQLSVIEDPKPGRSKHYAEWQAEKTGKDTWRSLIKRDVDEAIEKAMTDKQFFGNLERIGYSIKHGKDISVRPAGKERYVRLARNFGNDYTFDNICKRILANRHPRLPVKKQPPPMKPLKKFPPLLKGNIIGVYRHYKYLFGYYEKDSPSSRRMHFLLREDLRHFDAITQEMGLLQREGISTLEELNSFEKDLHSQISALTDKRRVIRAEMRTTRSQTSEAPKDPRIADVNEQLKMLRKEVRQCKNIAERSKILEEKIERIEQDESITTQQKEVKANGHIRRGSRTDREDESSRN